MRNAIQAKAAGYVKTGDFVRARSPHFRGPVFVERNSAAPGNVLLMFDRYKHVECTGDEIVETLERVKLPRCVQVLEVIDQCRAVHNVLHETGWPYEVIVDLTQYLRAGDAAHRASALEDVFTLV
jgi:hypothetical protein